MSKPKVLLFDIETAPLLGHVWGLWDNNVSLNQLQKDWHVLSWSAKWLDAKEEIYNKNRKPRLKYEDQRDAKDVSNDKKLLKNIWKLLDEADIVITQNGKAFDHKKLNARFVFHGMQPPSTYKHIDTALIARKHFAFTSNKLEYMTDKLCTRYKKLKHKKFPGHEMWVECLAGNKKAWREMERYNKHDVLALEELYYKLMPWDNSINFSLYDDSEIAVCSCGSTEFVKNGYSFTTTGKFYRFKCKHCGAETRSRQNLLTKSKNKSLRTHTSRS